MQEDRYTEFDLEVRRLLQDATEEVPSGLWESLSGELDRRDRKKVIGLWWKRAAVGVAAAAAVVSGIFIIGSHGDISSAPASNAVIAEFPVGTVSERAGSSGNIDEIPLIEDQIAASGNIMLSDIPVRKAAASEILDDTTVPSEAVPAAVFEIPSETTREESPAVPSDGNEERDQTASKNRHVDTVSEEPWQDPFAMLEDEKTEKGHRVSLSVSGNAMSNDLTGTGVRQMRAPASVTAHRTGVVENSESSYGVPMSFGLGVRYNFTDRWSVGSGIKMSVLSRSFNGIYYPESSNDSEVGISYSSKIDNDLRYIGVPLNIYYNILTNRNLKFYVWGGGEVEKGLTNHYRIQSRDGNFSYSENISGVQWSGAAGLGIEFMMAKHLGVYFDPSAVYYPDCDQPKSVRTEKPFIMNFEVGLRFNL